MISATLDELATVASSARAHSPAGLSALGGTTIS
jgi:hypothetical protein